MAGEYIEFNNNSQPALNDVNINRLQQLIKQDIQGAVSGDTLPIGVIIPFGGDTIPDNWLLCNGQAVSRTDYQELFNIIGITYGSGDGFTTFNLPDLQGKVVVGLDSNDTDFDNLGETGGEKTHTLILNETPINNVLTANEGAFSDGYIARAGYTSSNTFNFGGAGQPHNNLQPYIVQNYIIKAKQSAGVVATVVDTLSSTSATDALSAKQGKVLNEKIKTKYIVASTTTASNLSSDFQVLLNSEERQEGNAFTITNNRVVVGEGVSKVRVSGCIFVEGPQGTGYVWGKIMRNSMNTSTSLQPYNNGGGFLSASIPPTIVPVSEGDTFRLIADSTVQGKLRISGQATWLLIETVE